MPKNRILTLLRDNKPKEQFDRKNKVVEMFLLLVVVPEGGDKYVRDLLLEAEVPCNALFSSRALGTASSDLYEVLGIEDDHKRLISAPIRLDTYLEIAPKLEAKFKASRFSRGIAVLLKMSGLYGLSAYKMLSSYPLPLKTSEIAPEERFMEKKEAIFAIVNDGYSDLVMKAAKEAGARGGTIVHARGTGNKETESFYGIVVTPEKDMVIIIVDEEQKDTVLSAIGKECGLLSKGQGICFSIPVSGSVGLESLDSGNGEEGN